jgi:sirohydrochlorin ferrochelatase
VVLAAAGSSEAHARGDVRKAARALGRRLDSPVHVGYLAGGGGPRLDELLDELRATRRRIAVASWLLAPGLFQQRLADCGAQVCAQALSGHPGVAQAVLARYRHAVRVRSSVA